MYQVLPIQLALRPGLTNDPASVQVRTHARPFAITCGCVDSKQLLGLSDEVKSSAPVSASSSSAEHSVSITKSVSAFTSDQDTIADELA
jgi:hypothetical protein